MSVYVSIVKIYLVAKYFTFGKNFQDTKFAQKKMCLTDTVIGKYSILTNTSDGKPYTYSVKYRLREVTYEYHSSHWLHFSWNLFPT